MAFIQNPTAYENAVKRNILENARKTFRKSIGEEKFMMVLDFLDYNARTDTGYTDTFAGSLARAFDTYGKLTEKQVAAIQTTIDKRKAAREAKLSTLKEKGHVGEVGKRETFKVKCTRIFEHIRPRFSYYDSGLTFVHILETETGEQLVYRGQHIILREQEAATIKATIKEHGEYKGIKQTIIQRPAIQ